MKKKIVVIGAGFGGLAAAIRLAAKGHDVHLLDNRDKPGGRAYQYEIDGFKFDGGPTVITAPYIFDEIFEAVGKKKEDYINLVPLDIYYRFFSHDGKWLDYTGNLDELSKEVEKFNPGDVKGFKKLAENVKSIFNLFSSFTDKPFRNMKEMLRIIPPTYKLNGHIGTYRFVSKFIKNDFLRQVFSSHPLLIGGSPLETPSFYTLIAQFEREWGLYYSMNGTYAIIEAFAKLFREAGGTLKLNSEVTEIIFEKRKATGVVLKTGEKISADAVVCNSDVANTYLNLIPEKKRISLLSWRMKTMKYSVSLFVYYFGTKKRYLDSKLQHHNLIYGKNFKKQMKQLYNGKSLPEEMFLYLHMPSRIDSTISPEGTESFYVLSLVPNLRVDPGWENMAESYKDKIVDYLEENFLPDLRENIIAEHHIDPIHFRDTLKSYKGASFSFAPKLSQTAYLRPLNKSKRYENLYFVGAGTHPGPGVPAVISSGKIVADMIDS
ncbi:MAG TPA: phytoene desaturase [Bacteroidales bacterium]|nr:phytoene desaturase [Bacteroidales bacterium]